ncbi:MAG: TonB-dependent receptor [Flavobacteriaceae bacterium]|nr:TonB-dependent receptor [Flavobacteriaceae bacterium]
MRKIVFTFCLGIFSAIGFAQTAKDTIKTEVINVITSYTPTISDAFKIKKNPKIKLGNRAQKRTLKYQIFSAPVASTFIPKTGTAKGINYGPKEQLYKNYLALGYGNYNSPFAEIFLNKTSRSKSDVGLYAKYISSENSVDNTPLNSNFSNLVVGAYFQQNNKDYNWKIGANYELNNYNWYGLPNTIPFTPTTTNGIEELQKYNYVNLEADLNFKDYFFSGVKGNISSFSDQFSSKELRALVDPQFKISLKNIGRKLNDLIIATSFDYLNGEFAQSYSSTSKLEYSFFTTSLAPNYTINSGDFRAKLGTKLVFSSDLENKTSQVFIYPDVTISYPIVANFISLYLGAKGGLTTNTYKEFSDKNPFVAPTLFITQTNTKYDFFGGFNGKLSSNITYNLKASYSDVNDLPLYIRNNSKSDGTTSIVNTIPLKGYEYGNSFSVVYDDVKTVAFFGELSIELSKNLTVGANSLFRSYTTTSQPVAWNLPTMNAELFAKFTTNKWYANSNIFLVSERKDATYSGTYPSAINGQQTLKSYLDVNINGGYHFNDRFSAFLKMNNILNSDYQRLANFNVQGFQVLGGISYKFDF